jgi:hypothetical protein
MTSKDVSPGKNEPAKGQDYYQEKIANLERDIARNAVDLCMTLAQGRKKRQPRLMACTQNLRPALPYQ